MTEHKHRWTRWVKSFFAEYKRCLDCGAEKARYPR